MQDIDEANHPAMKDFSPTWEGFKHVLKKAVKWAVIGALVGGIAAAAIPFIGGAALSWIPWIGEAVVGGIGAKFAAGALGLGAATAVVGAISGFGEAHDAIDEAREKRIAGYERLETRALTVQKVKNGLAVASNQGQGVPVSSGLGIGMGGKPQEKGLNV